MTTKRRATERRERQTSSWGRQTMTRHRRLDYCRDASKCSHRSNQNHVLACKLHNQTPRIVGAMHALAREQPDYGDGPLNICNRFSKRRRLLQQGEPHLSKAPTPVQAISQLPGGGP